MESDSSQKRNIELDLKNPNIKNILVDDIIFINTSYKPPV
jgi:hypothetical protein